MLPKYPEALQDRVIRNPHPVNATKMVAMMMVMVVPTMMLTKVAMLMLMMVVAIMMLTMVGMMVVTMMTCQIREPSHGRNWKPGESRRKLRIS